MIIRSLDYSENLIVAQNHLWQGRKKEAKRGEEGAGGVFISLNN